MLVIFQIQFLKALKLNPAPNRENGWSYSHSEAAHEHKAFQY